MAASAASRNGMGNEEEFGPWLGKCCDGGGVGTLDALTAEKVLAPFQSARADMQALKPEYAGSTRQSRGFFAGTHSLPRPRTATW